MRLYLFNYNADQIVTSSGVTIGQALPEIHSIFVTFFVKFKRKIKVLHPNLSAA